MSPADINLLRSIGVILRVSKNFYGTAKELDELIRRQIDSPTKPPGDGEIIWEFRGRPISKTCERIVGGGCGGATTNLTVITYEDWEYRGFSADFFASCEEHGKWIYSGCERRELPRSRNSTPPKEQPIRMIEV